MLRSHSPVQKKNVFKVSKVKRSKVVVPPVPSFVNLAKPLIMNRRKMKELEKRQGNI